MRDHKEKLAYALETLEGLSVGDALGEALSYMFYEARENCDFSAFRAGTVRYTDDTEMAIAIVENLMSSRTIDEDVLAWRFASRYKKDPDRGYGRMARRILEEIAVGTPWKEVSMQAFGRGSFGNGAAMRVAPLGAYFSDDIHSVPELAAQSARVTHHHPEGIAGAIAVAVAAAVACDTRLRHRNDAVTSIWDASIELTPESTVRERIILARSMSSVSHQEAAVVLGNGTEISAQDTVPFCIWNACRCLENYREAFISTVEVGGDCDTNSAIVGSIVSSYAGIGSIPDEWLRVREKLAIRS